MSEPDGEEPSIDSPDDGVESQERAPWHVAPMDGIIIVALLALTNWFISKDDLGWRELNPSPWLLLPLFLGGRYGITAGLVGSGITASTILSLNRIAHQTDAISLLESEPYFFLAVLLVGAISSLIFTLVAGPVRQIRNRNEFLESQTRRLEENLELFHENEALLQRSLLLHGAEHTSLTGELNRLFTQSIVPIEKGLLELFQRLNGVESAAIYARGEATEPFTKVSALGESETWVFPEVIAREGSDFRIVELSLSHGEMATCRHLWETNENGLPVEENRLLAAMVTADKTLLLVIHRMAFEHINWESLGRLETIFHWTMARRGEAPQVTSKENAPTRAILPPEAFTDRLYLSRRAVESIGLQSHVIIFTPVDPSVNYESFVESLRSFAGASDSIGAVKTNGSQGGYSIALLTTIVSESATEAAAERILSRSEGGRDSIHYRIVNVANEVALTELGLLEKRVIEPVPEAVQDVPVSEPSEEEEAVTAPTASTS